jgi:hypothetical protein
MPPVRKATAGTIVYRTIFVPNPAYRPRERGLFSDEFLAEIRRANVAERRVVYFDGTRSRSEETNVDYGVRSLGFELRSADRDTVTTCKALRHFRFCVARPIGRPVTGRPPSFAPLDESATIAGLRCRKAEYIGQQRMHVWFSEDIDVEDPTGAVLHLEGVPGLILQTEEIADSDRIDAVRRITVAELSFAPPPPQLFAQPADYRTVDSLEVARAEDRRLLDANANGDTLALEKFTGEWLLETPHDSLRVEITPELRFRTTVLTAPSDAAGRTSEQQASLKGKVLVVEEPPNDRHYALSDDGRKLTQIGHALFTFTRASR